MITWTEVASCPESLLDNFRSPTLAVFCGSGISSFMPSQLPTGQEFRHLVVDDVTSCSAPSPLSLSLIEQMPMENVCECCPHPEQLGKIIRRLFNSKKSNPVHDLIAAECSKGHISNVITTNYDLCLDEALKNAGAGFIRVATETEAAIPAGDQIYFKIHGSTDSFDPGGLIFQLNEETQLPLNKMKLLNRLVTGRPLLLLGYSGLDFDICPVLANKPSRILWNFLRRDEISPGAERILNNPRFMAIEGDMTVLLNRIFRSPITVTRSAQPLSPSIFAKKFTKWEKAIWTLRLLNEIGCAVDADEAGMVALQNAAAAHEREAALSELARSYFHRGQYKKSAEMFTSAFWLAQSKRRKCELLLDKCDVYRVMGAPMRSVAAWVRARRLRDPAVHQLLALLELKKTLLLRDFDRVFKAVGLAILSKVTRRAAESSIKKGIATARIAGRWQIVQQFGILADRFGFSNAVVTSTQGLAPPPPREGYKHLGYRVAQFMAFRDDVRTTRGPLSDEIIEEGIKYSDLAEKMLAWPEAWKLLETIMKAAPAERSAARDRLVLRRFQHCEYTRLGRRFMRKSIS